MSGLDHPNILRLLYFSETDEYFYIGLEFCHGGGLSDKVGRTVDYSERNCRKIILQLVYGMKYLHEKGIIHQ